MMPVIRISDATFTDLRVLATWLETKTPSQAIEKVVSEAMEAYGLERDALSELEAPGLSFTKLLKASVDHKKLVNPKWNGLLYETLRAMKEREMTSEQIVDALNIPARKGEFEENGYVFYPDLGLSFQGQSAPNAWKEIQRLAPQFRIDVEVSFEWRKNPKAQYPGQKGELRA